CAVPLLLSSLLDVWQAWDAILRVVLSRGFARGVEFPWRRDDLIGRERIEGSPPSIPVTNVVWQ
ncbi:MAG: hypothetical protein ACK6A7_10705, partial [Planctomycetota bacterium]